MVNSPVQVRWREGQQVRRLEAFPGGKQAISRVSMMLKCEF
jgi:hypothetical protein